MVPYSHMYGRALMAENLLSMAIPLVLLVALPLSQFFLVFIVFGYAHFALAYYYQWKAGKFSRSFLAVFAIYALLSAAFIASSTLAWQIAVAGGLFIAHHFYDEMRLLGSRETARRLSELSVPAFLFAAWYFGNIFADPLWVIVSLAGASLSFLSTVLVWRFSAEKFELDLFTTYMVLVSLATSYFIVFHFSFAPGALIGVLIIFHYLKWYGFIYRKTATRGIYLRDVAIANVVCVGAYALAAYSGNTILMYPFTQSAFYYMAILHIIASFMQARLFSRALSYVGGLA